MRRGEPEVEILNPDTAYREFVEFAEGTALPAQIDVRTVKVRFTEELMRSLAGVGLATILFQCRRGNLKAAIYLVDRCLGIPDQPYTQSVESMSSDEVEQALFAEFRAQGLTSEVAQALVEASKRTRTADYERN